MARSSSVMIKESVEAAWINNLPIQVLSDDSCLVDIEVTGARAPGVCYFRENTKIVCPDGIMPQRTVSKTAALTSLVASEKMVNAKHFIVTKYAKTYLEILNKVNPHYSDELAIKTNLYYVDLETKPVVKSNPSAIKVDILDTVDLSACEALSKFQQERLQSFRRLLPGVTTEKIKDRYSLSSFLSRVSSPEVVTFFIQDQGVYLATFTLNLHLIADAPESQRFGYLSDLFVAEGREYNAELIVEFFSGVFSEIGKKFSIVKVLSVMAAPGDSEIPIVKCFEHARKAGLIHLFTRADQDRLGVVAQFTLDKSN